ncbi:MAG: cytochrome b/b6 domain-containing protein [Candidatus Zixiibacteriota bacterium]
MNELFRRTPVPGTLVKTTFALALLLLVGFSPLSASNEACMECHSDNTLTGAARDGSEISMFIHLDSLLSSSHGSFECVDCHADLAGITDFPHNDELKPVQCGTCHDDVNGVFMTSAHGKALDNPNAPNCQSCHGSHAIFPQENPASKTSAKNLPNTCAACHHKIALKEDSDIRITDSFDRYIKGIHAEGIQKGIGSAASCNDCHGTHDLKKASDPASMVNKQNIPKTCSKCHNDISIQYFRGIHGKALQAGILDAPNCTDCHGEHEIRRIGDPDSPVNQSNLADYVCGRCHNDPQLMEKYGLAEGRFTSYQDSYHGLAIRGGSIKAANCISCHRAHDILPSANPASSVSRENIVETCQTCHPKANLAFATSYTHKTAQQEFNPIDRWVRFAYILAIVLIIGGMLVHNGIIIGAFVVQKHRQNKAQPTVLRFTGNMVFQHLVLTVAFIVLVITGFALRFPDSWWVGILNFFGIFEDTRSVIHRIAAVFLIYVSLHHGLFLFISRRGKEQLRGFMPVKQDFTDVIQNVKFHLGLTDQRPQFDMYDYTEKAEYWALVWGTIAMVLTGFVLWFPTFFTGFMPAWIVKVSETIHYYEAWLATLAIAVFHFFFVIFHPEQYPMSFAWITGRVTVESVKHHHPKWYRRMFAKKNGTDDNTKA